MGLFIYQEEILIFAGVSFRVKVWSSLSEGPQKIQGEPLQQ